MTTRSEPCTKPEYEAARAPARTSPLVWDAVLCLSVLAYVVLTLFGGFDSPLLSLAVVFVVGRRLFQPRNGRVL